MSDASKSKPVKKPGPHARAGHTADYYQAPPDSGQNVLFVLTVVAVPLAFALLLFAYAAFTTPMAQWWLTKKIMFVCLISFFPLILALPLLVWRGGKTMVATAKAGKWFRIILLALPFLVSCAATAILFYVMDRIGCQPKILSDGTSTIVCMHQGFDYADFLFDFLFMSFVAIAFSVFAALVFYNQFHLSLHRSD